MLRERIFWHKWQFQVMGAAQVEMAVEQIAIADLPLNYDLAVVALHCGIRRFQERLKTPHGPADTG